MVSSDYIDCRVKNRTIQFKLPGCMCGECPQHSIIMTGS